MRTLFSALVAFMATLLTAVFLSPWGQPLNYFFLWIVFFGLAYLAALTHREQGQAAREQRSELWERYRARPAQSPGGDWLVRHMVLISVVIALVVFLVGLYLIQKLI